MENTDVEEVVVEQNLEDVEEVSIEIEPKQEEKEEEEKPEIERGEFLKEILGENYNEDIYKDYMEQAEKYDLTNDELRKYNEIVNEDFEKNRKNEIEKETAHEEFLISELEKLSPEEKNEVSSVYDFWESNSPDGMKGVFDELFQTAEGFRTAKTLMNSMSQSLPEIENRSEPVKEFGQEEYSKMSDEIRQATADMDFDKARSLKEEMKNKIRSNGTEAIKKDLANFIK